tara:strand:+ start:335 stop:1456 length:1122 start_codon:yes stop_codon:yes gene_type:complete
MGLMNYDYKLPWDEELTKTVANVFDRGNGAIGAVVGSAIADAVGAGYEFTRGVAESERDDIGPIGGGPFNWKPGQWTDDTEQAVALLGALTNDSDTNVTRAADNILAWYVSEPADIGSTTLAVLRAALHHKQVEGSASVEACFTAARRHAVAHDSHRMDQSPILTTMQGCGAFMRLSSCALLPTELEAENWAVATAMLTHGSIHVANLAASLGPIIWRASRLKGEALDHLFDGVFDHLDSDQKEAWETLLHDRNPDVASMIGPDKLVAYNGTAPGAMACALLAIVDTTLLHGDYRIHAERWFRRCIQHAVSQGGDTDSVAAITGAIAGGIVGYRHLPAAWRQILHGFDHDGNLLDENDLVKMSMNALHKIGTS